MTGTPIVRWLSPLPLWTGILAGPLAWALDLTIELRAREVGVSQRSSRRCCSCVTLVSAGDRRGRRRCAVVAALRARVDDATRRTAATAAARAVHGDARR